MHAQRHKRLLAAIVTGCVAATLIHFFSHPTFPRHLVHADSVVLNQGAGDPERTVAGDEAERIIRALASADRIPGPAGLKLLHRLSFYDGTNCLASVSAYGDLFAIDGALEHYRAKAGTLSSLFGGLHEQ